MSPEQARGQDVDKRTDIWAFGCILFEVLTRTQAFEGPTISDTIAAVLRAEAPWARLPPGTHPAISRLLRRCLQKDPRKRLQHIGDARLELLDAREAAADIQVRDTPKVRRAWLVAAAAVIAAASGLTGWLLAPSPAPAPISRFSFPIPDGALTTTSVGFEVALSPDGRTLLISGPGIGIRKRRLDAVTFEALRGAEDGAGPFFSPDGAWVGFLADGKLKKVPIEGGPPTTIGDVPFQARGTWGEEGSIVVGGVGGLFRIPDSGGSLELILKAPEGEFIAQPRFLPGSQAVLVKIAADGPTGGASGRIEVVELASAQRHVLATGSAPQLGPTGDLLFQQEGSLWAVRFNQRRFDVDGRAVRVVESMLSQSGVVAFATSRDGSLVFIAGGAVPGRSLVWLDRAGRVTPALDVRGEFQSPRLSPDGKSVVVSVADGTSLDLWRYEFDRGTRLRLTTDGRSRRTTWSPDGKQVAFYTAELAGGGSDLYVISSTGGEPTRLLEKPGLQYPDSWSPDGRFLIFENGEGSGARISARRDLWLLPIGEAPRPFVVTRFYERGAVFAPNGRLVGYVSDESGRPEIYVQPFPGPGPKVPISTNGGLQPVWSRDGRELFYREGDSLMAAAVQQDPFRAGPPQKLFDLPAALYNMDQNFADYDLAPDGRFVAVRGESAGGQSVQVVLNWSETLRQALGR
jgi:serine/threonine-protein kinase